MTEKLDILFSKYIRLRDTDSLGNGRCFTCSKVLTYQEGECGHFRHRRHMCTRWHPGNAHMQCFDCNRGDDMVTYLVAMMKAYTADETDEIITLSNQSCKFTKQELKEMYAEYRAKIKELLSEKMFIIKY